MKVDRAILVVYVGSLQLDNAKQLQQRDKLTWYLSNFGKTKRILSNTLANQLGKNKT
jgi:hypothetical protein